MGLHFRPTDSFYHEFVLGRTKPCDAYLIAGPQPDGYCLGLRQATVLVPFRAVVFDELCPNDVYMSPHPFGSLSLFSYSNPMLKLAEAETRYINAFVTFKMQDLTRSVDSECSYQEDLDRLLSVDSKLV